MQTTPPMVMASAPKAGAVQPLTRKMAAGGHERGDGHAGDGAGRRADEADDARADGDEEKSEDDDEQRRGEIGGPADERAGNGLELEEEEHAGRR